MPRGELTRREFLKGIGIVGVGFGIGVVSREFGSLSSESMAESLEYCPNQVSVKPEANQLGQVWDEESKYALNTRITHILDLFGTVYADKKMRESELAIFPLSLEMAQLFKQNQPELTDLIDQGVPVVVTPEVAQERDKVILPGFYWPGQFTGLQEDAGRLAHGLFQYLYGRSDNTEGRFSPDGAAILVAGDNGSVTRESVRIVNPGDTWDSVADTFCLNKQDLQAVNPQIQGELLSMQQVCLPLPLSICPKIN